VAFDDLQELGGDGKMLEHADVRTTRIAGGNGSNDRANRTKHNARSLPEYCGGLATMNRNPEHEPV